MSNLKIAAAQVPSIKGNVSSNIDIHLEAIEKAGSLGVSYLVFPELSLTGYESELANTLAFSADDSRIKPLVRAAQKNHLYAVVGAPLLTDGLPHIGAFIIAPTANVCSYSKMRLHPGEEKFFSPGINYQLIQLGGEKVATAICADANAAEHVRAYTELGATIYASGAMITAGGYIADTETLQDYAREYGILVVMANHCEPTGSWQPVGKSSIWGTTGLIACAGESRAALVTAQRTPSGWVGEVLEI